MPEGLAGMCGEHNSLVGSYPELITAERLPAGTANPASNLNR
jgi:hypothetical protein